jgi:uncharacterized protein YyaL (SSP411 family)
LTSYLENAACWFQCSGIQEASGGVARYYRSDIGCNLPVSNEITGYAASALAYFCSITGDTRCRDAAIRAARFLTREAWDASSNAFPFEPGSDRAYFFDTGIIVRGLFAIWRMTGEQEFLDRAREAALSLAFDFMGDGEYYPIVSLPDKQPLAYEPRWSRGPGCYQLKSALAWHDIAKACGDEHAEKLYESALAAALKTHESFLAAEPDQERLMDRLHAYSYFLEGLLASADRADVRAALAGGLARASALHREIAPLFERSDVAAQLLRVRLIAHHLDAVPLKEADACEEAARAASYQAPIDHADPHLRGGFFFGKRRGELLPFSNPVSTAFCAQALELWRQHQEGRWSFDLQQLI